MSNYSDIFDAAKKGTVADMEYFIENEGVDVNARDFFGNTPLHYVAERFPVNLELLEYLIAVNADVNAGDEPPRGGLDTDLGKTPLFKAAERCSDVRVLELLISAGANPNATSDKGIPYNANNFAFLRF